MPKKAKKTPKIDILSDSDDDKDAFTVPTKKKGCKFAISDSDDDDDVFPKSSTSKGKFWLTLAIAISRTFTNEPF